MSSDDEVDVEVVIKAETSMAYLVSDENVEVWVPKSQIICQSRSGQGTMLTLPVWLAEDKGLV